MPAVIVDNAYLIFLVSLGAIVLSALLFSLWKGTAEPVRTQERTNTYRPSVVAVLFSFGGRIKPQDAATMIACIWHGVTSAKDYDAYWNLLHARAIPDYRATRDNLGVRLCRRLDGERAHFLTLSYWKSLDSIRAFAGDDIARAKYYPEDTRYLLEFEFEPTVVHYETTESDTADLSRGQL